MFTTVSYVSVCLIYSVIELNKSHIIHWSDPGLRIESFAVINLRGFSTNESIIYDACDVTLSVYPHRVSLKNMSVHGGNRTYDLCNTSPILCQLSYAVTSVRVCDSICESPRKHLDFLEFWCTQGKRVNEKTVLRLYSIFVNLVTAHLSFKNCTNGFRTAHFV